MVGTGDDSDRPHFSQIIVQLDLMMAIFHHRIRDRRLLDWRNRKIAKMRDDATKQGRT